MHQIAQIWTYIFTNFPLYPRPQNWGGGKPTSPRRVRPPSHLFRAFAAAAPIKSPNMQPDFTNPSYIYIFLYFWCYYSWQLASKVHYNTRKIAQNCAQNVQKAFAVGAYDVPPDILVGWGW